MAQREVLKKVKNAILYDDGRIRIDNVRFSYPHLAKPYSGEDGSEPKYGIVGIMPKETHAAAKELIDEHNESLLKDAKIKGLPSDKKYCRDGDDSGKEEYADAWTVSAREAANRPPSLRNASKQKVEREDADAVFQPGYWGSILIRPWVQNNKYGKRINAGLDAVQFVKKDEVFAQGRLTDDDVDDAFDSFDDDDDAFDDDDDI